MKAFRWSNLKVWTSSPHMVNFSNVELRRFNRVVGRARVTRRAISYCAVSLLAAVTLAAQDSQNPSPITNRSIPSMVGQLFDQDFVNFYVFGNANYDNRIPLQSSSITNQFGAWGYTVGGGVTLARRLHDGDLSLSYRGDYRDYFNSSYGSGTDQNLSLLYDKRLSRRWTVSIPVSAGILLYGSGGYSFATGAGSLVSPNSLSPETRFVQTGVNLTYQQTKRLSYVFGGTYFLNNYNYSAAIGSTGVSGSGSVMYRLTGRTTLGATYSHSYYHYTQNAGQTSIDSES